MFRESRPSFVAGVEFQGKENWSSQKPPSEEGYRSPNRIESQREFSDQRYEQLVKKISDVHVAVSLRSEKISEALREIVAHAEGREDGQQLLETLDNEYFSVESLAKESLDLDNEDQIASLLHRFKEESDYKTRIQITKQIEELR